MRSSSGDLVSSFFSFLLTMNITGCGCVDLLANWADLTNGLGLEFSRSMLVQSEAKSELNNEM